ncbi:hypothetical protein NECAME_05854 [Necator americanus]|uniref:Uncharacterized protein n=1 Tax=Necator americanus TaxID=51031 RepID=W2TYC4_NECAM|nr:hypothetical protein NECAME_05854 [Necator americanus]ETN86679.1 hypothetical protein NECAME_05854 [Necator americanus]
MSIAHGSHDRMGTSASAHKTAVRSISIDQDGWNRPCSGSRGSSAASRRSLPVLLNFVGNKSSRDERMTKGERIRLVDRAMRAESAAAECESKMKGMEREIRTLELRNHDLSTEVCWLRQQCTISCPDVPNGSMASFVPPSCSEQCQVEKRLLHDTVAKQNADLSKMRLEVERFTALDIRKDIRISELIKELDAAKARIAGLEGEEVEKDGKAVEGKREEAVCDDISEEIPEEVEDGNTVRGPTKNSNLRIQTSRPRPSFRNIFAMGKEQRIDGKSLAYVRPNTAVEQSSSEFLPPPLERVDTVPVLRSIEIMHGIPSENKNPNEIHRDVDGDPYFYEKDIVEDSGADSDIDVTDILGSSNKSMAMRLRCSLKVVMGGLSIDFYFKMHRPARAATPDTAEEIRFPQNM